jgi:hypothetical protein
LHNIHHWHSFHPLGECVDHDEKESKTSWCPGQDAHDVDSLNCKGSGEINMPKRICMLYYLLMKELTILAFSDNLHRVILSSGPLEIMPEGFAYNRAP